MNTLNQDHIVRFISAFRWGKPDALGYYLIFEWADGGNLHDFWKATPKPEPTASLVKAVVTQLLGLAQALSAAHYLTDGGAYSGASYRHGDLKPANILWFRDGSDQIGKLKICDWGEAKNHILATEMRRSNTSAKFGTRRYEAPEIVTGLESNFLGRPDDQPDMRRSRLCDVWAMGCIMLECIVWLLYGHSTCLALRMARRLPKYIRPQHLG